MTKEVLLIKIGKNVRRLREEAKLSQVDLGHLCEKDKQSINRLEQGKINPSIFYLSEIAAVLKVPLKELVEVK